jgi:hypothetical protein
MPEINHKDVAAALNGSPVSAAALEEAIKRVLAKGKQERIEAAQPKEPNWATMTEQDAYKASTYIPTVEHEVPDYMNIKLKDPEYEVVWASKDQRRIGQLMAEGYEFLIAEHVHPNFKLPLVFDSDKHYCYVDVIALRVHKRILYGKRRAGLELSQRQLGNNRRPPAARVSGTFDLQEVPMNPEVGSFYDPVA